MTSVVEPTPADARPQAEKLTSASRPILRLFELYARNYFKRHFSALYFAGPEPHFHREAAPYVIFLNHPSWWDPLVSLILARRFCGELSNYAPIDDKMLKRFPFFRRLGFFGVEKGLRHGALQFIQAGRAILNGRGTALWITPQNDFFDPRSRPLALKPGIALLAELGQNIRYVPLALDYSFGSERLPMVAARFGDEILSADFPYRSRDEWTQVLSDSLARTQELLIQDVISRRVLDSPRIVTGRMGTGGIYGAWQKLRGG